MVCPFGIWHGRGFYVEIFLLMHFPLSGGPKRKGRFDCFSSGNKNRPFAAFFKSTYENFSLHVALLDQLGSKSIALVFNCAKTNLSGKTKFSLTSCENILF